MTESSAPEPETTDTPNPVQEIPQEQLDEVIRQRKQRRADACMAEIQEALERHRCALNFTETKVNGEVVRKTWSTVTIRDQD